MPTTSTRRASRAMVAILAGVAVVGAWTGGPADARSTAGEPVGLAARGGDPAPVTSPTPPPTAAPEDAAPDDPAPDDAAAKDAAPEPACTGPVRVSPVDPNTRWRDIVVDPVRRLPEGYEPDDLVEVPEVGYGSHVPRVRDGMVADLQAMHAAAREAGAPFWVVSAFRSEAHQRRLWEQAVATEGGVEGARDGTARPGHSEHQLGTTIDVVDPGLPELVDRMARTPAGRWLAAHATDFGFVVSYPAGQSAATCYKPEPWHLRYVGREQAAAMVGAPLSPREFLLNRLRSERGPEPALGTPPSPAATASPSGRG